MFCVCIIHFLYFFFVPVLRCHICSKVVGLLHCILSLIHKSILLSSSDSLKIFTANFLFVIGVYVRFICCSDLPAFYQQIYYVKREKQNFVLVFKNAICSLGKDL